MQIGAICNQEIKSCHVVTLRWQYFCLVLGSLEIFWFLISQCLRFWVLFDVLTRLFQDCLQADCKVSQVQQQISTSSAAPTLTRSDWAASHRRTSGLHSSSSSSFNWAKLFYFWRKILPRHLVRHIGSSLLPRSYWHKNPSVRSGPVMAASKIVLNRSEEWKVFLIRPPPPPPPSATNTTEHVHGEEDWSGA